MRASGLHLWDLESGALLRTFEGHRDSVNAVAVLPDGRRALSGSDDSTLKLWDLESVTLLRTFEGHERAVAAVAVLPDGRRALSSSKGWSGMPTVDIWRGQVTLWDVESGAVLRALEGPRWDAMAVLPDGRLALSGLFDGTLTLWDLESATLLRTLDGHGSAVAVLRDGRRALSGDNMWDLESGCCLATFAGDAEIVSVAAAGDDLFVAGAANGALHILRLLS